MDDRMMKLAQSLLTYSVSLKKGDRILIEAKGARTFPIAELLIQEVYKRGAYPYFRLYDEYVDRAFLSGAAPEQLETLSGVERTLMEKMDCYLNVKGFENVFENSDVRPECMKHHAEWIFKKVHFEVRIPKTRWCVLRFPNPSFAQAARMPLRVFEDFYYKTCLLDYAAMSRAMDPLVELMSGTDQVRITGPGTDLSFSIKGIPTVKCDGHWNIPDGELFTAPVKTSVNGTVFFNTATIYEGGYFDGIRLEFRDGKIVAADCATGDKKRLNDILDSDDGARYIGEFAIGVNPRIREPMLDTLFDEKIAGSIHLTPGSCYDEASNGNKSQIHWDIVLRQLKEYGGGEIYFDAKLVRKDGLFVLDSLKGLNP